MSQLADRMQDGWLWASRGSGLFHAARLATRRAVRILCYHGFTNGDLLDFRPGLFISPSTFEKRLRFLATHGYPVLSLQGALAGLSGGDLPDHATVITVDDVFEGVLKHALPLLRSFGMPATLYVTTYYSVKRQPVFRLVVRYMFWKSQVMGARIEFGASETTEFLRADSAAWRRAEERAITFGESLDSEPRRVAFAEQLGALLGVDYETIARNMELNVVTPEEIRELAGEGIDVQLHTHRHRLPERQDLVEREIADNRGVLEPLVGSRLTHLCYPSGIWSPMVWPWLEQCGITSATTCDPGLNRPSTPRLALKRILDSEELSQTRFEAEMSGYKHLARAVASAIRR